MSDVAIVSTLLAYAAVLLVALLGLFAAGWVSGYGAGHARGRRAAARRTTQTQQQEEGSDV